mgnify:CR=1 FL=1
MRGTQYGLGGSAELATHRTDRMDSGTSANRTQRRSEHTDGHLAVSAGRDQGCKLIVVLLMA